MWPSIRRTPTTSSPSGNRTAGPTVGRTATSPAIRSTAVRRGRSAHPRSRDAAGGVGDTGDYERATDPWLSLGPTGRLHAIALVFDNSTPRNAVLAAFSDNGGATWSTPRIVQFDNPRALGNNFNDKETLTADPSTLELVYATWQRIVSPSDGRRRRATRTPSRGTQRPTSHGPRTAARHGSRPARSSAERGRHMQTIGNQVEVLPDGTLINGFNMIRASPTARGSAATSRWCAPPTRASPGRRRIVVNRLLVDEVADPDDGHDVRTGDILPDWAVDRSSSDDTRGNIYVVWMDPAVQRRRPQRHPTRQISPTAA